MREERAPPPAAKPVALAAATTNQPARRPRSQRPAHAARPRRPPGAVRSSTSAAQNLYPGGGGVHRGGPHARSSRASSAFTELVQAEEGTGGSPDPRPPRPRPPRSPSGRGPCRPRARASVPHATKRHVGGVQHELHAHEHDDAVAAAGRRPPPRGRTAAPRGSGTSSAGTMISEGSPGRGRRARWMAPTMPTSKQQRDHLEGHHVLVRNMQLPHVDGGGGGARRAVGSGGPPAAAGSRAAHEGEHHQAHAW